jgi:hypothetical protein
MAYLVAAIYVKKVRVFKKENRVQQPIREQNLCIVNVSLQIVLLSNVRAAKVVGCVLENVGV